MIPIPRISIVTAFPELVRSYLGASVLGRGIESGKLDVEAVDIRSFANGEYRQIDDYSFGGGGMVLMAAPLERALEHIAPRTGRYVVYPSPQGTRLHQELVEDLRRIAARKRLVIVCGHYEGVDERFVERNVDLEFSLGDFVLTGGELPALALVDAVSRLVDGVVGKSEAVREDSFYSGMLDHPHYTRPASYDGVSVPEVLIGGDHAAIESYRRSEAVGRTIARRPDLLARAGIGPYMGGRAYVVQLHYPVLDRNGGKSTTAITGMDLHDIARACRTFGVERYAIATPLKSQRDMIAKIASHWTEGYGLDFNPDRAEAMRTIKTFASLEQVLRWIEKREKSVPMIVGTTARLDERATHWTSIKREVLESGRPLVLIFGTGHGLHEEVLTICDAIMTPISGAGEPGNYNHLSIRSAASVVLDRFFGFR